MIENPVEEYLRTCISGMVEAKKARGITQSDYYSEAELILKYGRSYIKVIPRPSFMKKGKEQQCYENVYNIVRDNQGKYNYCEGYATVNDRFFVFHAWLVNNIGEVIDPTLENGLHCYGIIFKFPYVRDSMAKAGCFISILENLYERVENESLVIKSSTELQKYIISPDKPS